MPTPRKDETKDEYIKRCIPYVIKEGTAKNPKQAYAICLSMWKKYKEKEEMSKEKRKIFTCDAVLDIITHEVTYTATINSNGNVTYEEKNKAVEKYEITAAIGNRFMNGGYLSEEEIKNSLDKWNGTLHDINHEGIGAFGQDIRYFVGYHTNVRYDNGALKMTLNIVDDTEYAKAWRGYVNLCKAAGKTPNVSITYMAEQEFIEAKELPNYKDYGLKENDKVPILKNIVPLAVSTVVIGRCNDSDGCGVDTGEEEESTENIEENGVVPSNPSNYGKSETSWSAPSLKDFTSKSWDELSDAEKRHIASHFAWSATMPPEKYGDLKLPHHEPKSGAVNRNAVRAALAAVAGARGGVDIPAADKSKVLAHLRHHAEELGMKLKGESDEDILAFLKEEEEKEALIRWLKNFEKKED